MHIAWLGKKSPFCGNVTYSREVTNSLLDRDYRVSFLHFATEDSNHEDWPHCEEVFLPYIYRSQAYTLPSLKSSKVLQQSLKDLKPDLVHASLALSPLDLRLPEICEDLKIPLVATFHVPFDSKQRNFSASTQYLNYQFHAPFLANYDKVIIFSGDQKDLLVKLGVEENRIAVIPNGVDEKKYNDNQKYYYPDRSPLKERFQAEHLFVYMGRIVPEKNVESLLKAWKSADLGSNCKLLIVGDGVLTSSLKPFYGEEYNIIWLGYVGSEEERIEILKGADAFILPSLVEGLSISLLEAMACGTACIATEAGADGEALEGAGVVLETKGVTTLIKNYLRLFRYNPELYATFGKKARQRILERYTLDGNIDRLEDVYREVLQNKPSSLSLL